MAAVPLATSAAPGIALPGAIEPGSTQYVQAAVSAMIAYPQLIASATEGPDLNALWTTFLVASQAAKQAEDNWHMTRQAGGTDGTAGFMYQKAYIAQQAADQAYTAWQTAQSRVYPGVRG